jgi:sporulation protein YqfC
MKKVSVSQKKEMVVESLKLPKDVLLGAIRLELTGNTEVWIENYKGIIEYTDKSITLQGKTCRVCVEGKNLTIDYYTNDDMKISGCIANVKYL